MTSRNWNSIAHKVRDGSEQGKKPVAFNGTKREIETDDKFDGSLFKLGPDNTVLVALRDRGVLRLFEVHVAEARALTAVASAPTL